MLAPRHSYHKGNILFDFFDIGGGINDGNTIRLEDSVNNDNCYVYPI